MEPIESESMRNRNVFNDVGNCSGFCCDGIF
jgi:hypothetical protein